MWGNFSKRTVHERCNLGARHRWGIESGILVEKHQGYQYEHCLAQAFGPSSLTAATSERAQSLPGNPALWYIQIPLGASSVRDVAKTGLCVRNEHLLRSAEYSTVYS